MSLISGSSKFKLCIVTPNFFGGGAERIAVNLANHYSEQGINVVLIAFNGTGQYKCQIKSNVKVVDLKVRMRKAFIRFYQEIKRQNPTHILSVLQSGNIVVGLSLLFYRKPKLIFREANTYDELKNQGLIRRSIALAKVKLGYFRANALIANSPDTKSDLVRLRIKDPKFVKVIANPVLPSDYMSLAQEGVNCSWFDKGYKVVLNVGRLHPQKNQTLLIDSFNEVVKVIPKARLLILGDGELRDTLLQHIKSLNLTGVVKLIPFQKNPWPYYMNSKVFVLTSDWEGFGNVIVEALSCGATVISSDCPGGPRYILEDGKYGVLIKPGSVFDFSQAIIASLSGTREFDKDELVARANKYSVESIAAQYLSFIKEV